MTLQRKSKQRGISFIGLVIVASLLAMAGVVAAQIFPTVLEYQAISKAVDRAKQGQTVAEARMIFDKAAAILSMACFAGGSGSSGQASCYFNPQTDRPSKHAQVSS